jgi:hypothetical protein
MKQRKGAHQKAQPYQPACFDPSDELSDYGHQNDYQRGSGCLR